MSGRARRTPTLHARSLAILDTALFAEIAQARDELAVIERHLCGLRFQPARDPRTVALQERRARVRERIARLDADLGN